MRLDRPQPVARLSQNANQRKPPLSANRFLVPLATAAFVLGVGGSAQAETPTSIIGVVVVTAAPTETTNTTTTTTTTTTRPTTSTPVARRVITCENARNHGEYVSSRSKGERAAAAKSDCGKPHRPTTTLAGPTTMVTTTVTAKPVTTVSAAATSTTLKHDDDERGEDENENGKANHDKGKGPKGRGNAKGTHRD